MVTRIIFAAAVVLMFAAACVIPDLGRLMPYHLATPAFILGN